MGDHGSQNGRARRLRGWLAQALQQPLLLGVKANHRRPEGVFGATVAAAASTLTAARVSLRETSRLREDLCGIRVGVASVETLVKQASAALEDPYVRILAYLDDAAVRCADETLTSWREAGNSRWLSVAAAVDAALFQIATRRDRDATRTLLGDDPNGVIVSDRYSVYLYIDAGIAGSVILLPPGSAQGCWSTTTRCGRSPESPASRPPTTPRSAP